MSFGERLRELREENKVTQKDLGKLLGVGDHQVGWYETDKGLPRTEANFQRIFERFGVSADYLFGLTRLPRYEALNRAAELYQQLSEENRRLADEFLQFLLWKQEHPGRAGEDDA